MNKTNQDKIDLSKFDESDPCQHQMKIAFGCGSRFSFHGNDKHIYLAASNVIHREFSENHDFAGYEWYGIDKLQDKSSKLSIHTDHVRDTKIFIRLSVMDNDPLSGDLGGSIKNWPPG